MNIMLIFDKFLCCAGAQIKGVENSYKNVWQFRKNSIPLQTLS